MTTWLVMAIAGLGTYTLRVSMVVAHESIGTPRWLERRFHLVGPSVLGAIVVSALVLAEGRQATPDVATLAAVVGAFVAARRTRNVMWAMAVGFPVYWGATALVSI